MKKLSYLFILLFGIISCEKDIDLNLKEIPPTPVVDACISNNSDESHIIISMTKGFKRENSEYQYITDAQISVTDNDGNQIPFYYDINANMYKTDVDAIPGKVYHFEASFDDYLITGEEALLDVPVISDVNINLSADEYGFQQATCEIEIEDNSEDIDYYRIELIVDEEYESYISYSFLTNEYEKDNDKFKFSSFLPETGTFTICVYHIPKNYYDFLTTLYDIGNSNYGQSPFNTTVMGNPESNLNTKIGFFGSCSVAYETVNL